MKQIPVIKIDEQTSVEFEKALNLYKAKYGFITKPNFALVLIKKALNNGK